MAFEMQVFESGDGIAATDYGDAFLYRGDCLRVMRAMIDQGFSGQIDSVVCDPPYGIAFGGEVWDSPDTVAFRSEVWTLALQLLRPGGHLIAFSARRTFHHLAVAIERAGFEIRDQLLWLYGTGNPANQDVGKFIDKQLGAVRGVKRIPRSATGNTKARSQTRPNIELAKLRGFHETADSTPITAEAIRWDGWGNNLKPAHEPMVLARKPLAETSIARNVLAHGTGCINVDASRVPEGNRFPATVIVDGSADVADILGAASRYFYAAKASRAEKGATSHLTVKPLSLMRYLTRLVTPPGGVVLDPFCGSGTTLEAGVLEGFRPIGIELTPDYWPDVDARMRRAMGGSLAA